jgi:hypothetical protein
MKSKTILMAALPAALAVAVPAMAPVPASAETFHRLNVR